MSRLVYLDRRDVESVAQRLATKLFGDYPDPFPKFQLREGGTLLESALGIVRQPYYRTAYDKAGALLRSLIKNHPLVDGNKRVGLAATFVFLLLNDRVLVASNEEMVRFALEIAQSEPAMPWQKVASWIRGRTVSIAAPDSTALRMMKRLPEEWQDQDALAKRILEYQSALEFAGFRSR